MQEIIIKEITNSGSILVSGVFLLNNIDKFEKIMI